MIRTADLLYGAFELKSRYQRNMIMGTLSAALLATTVIGSVWIYTMYFHPEVIPTVPPLPPDGIIDTIIFIQPFGPPTDPKDLPGGNGGFLPPPPPEYAGGRFTPIDDSVFQTETEFDPPDKNTTYGIYNRDQKPDWTGGGGIIGADPGGIYIPKPEEFIPHEINPVLVNEVVPDYPRIPLEAGFTGWVQVQAFVDKSGKVLKAEAVRCSRPGMGFEDEAVKAALKCRYRPAIQNGEAVGVWITYRVEFKL